MCIRDRSYTKPREWRGLAVPDVLTSGNHALVDKWRREQALLRTWQRRPELLEVAELDKDDRAFIAQLEQEAKAKGEG